MQEMRPSAWMRRAVLVGALANLVPAVNAAAQVPSSSQQVNSSEPSSSSLLTLAPNLIQFPAVPLGMISSQTVRIMNAGRLPMIVRKAVVDVSALTVSGLSKPIVLAAGEALNLTVAFRPERIGKLVAKLTLEGDAGGAGSQTRMEALVNGEAVPAKPELTVESETQSFGTVQVGSDSRQTVRVVNTGNQDVQMGEARISGRSFAVHGTSGIRLAAGEAAEFEVSFHPQEAGSQEGVLELGNSAGEAIRIVLSGDAETRSQRPMTLHWQADSDTPGQGYYVYRGTAMQGPFEKLNSVPVATPEFTDENLSAGRQYFYVVTSVNENGDESPFSEPILAQAP
jgi:hypothetical protein